MDNLLLLKCKMAQDRLRRIWPEWLIEDYIGGGLQSDVFLVRRDFGGRNAYAALKVERVGPVRDIHFSADLAGIPHVVRMEDFHVEDEADERVLYLRMEHLASLQELYLRGGCGKKSRGEGIFAGPNAEGEGGAAPAQAGWHPPGSVAEEERPLLAAPEARKLGLDIGKALATCGDRGIRHLYIKPSCLFRDRFGRYKIGNFPLSPEMESARLRQLSGGMGDISYLAPEVFAGGPCDGRTDIYGLGLSLYQLLNRGRIPFQEDSARVASREDLEAANYRRLRGDAISPIDGVDGVLMDIVLRALAFSAGDRFPDADAFCDALEAYRPSAESAGGLREGHAMEEPFGEVPAEDMSTGEKETGHSQRSLWKRPAALLGKAGNRGQDPRVGADSLAGTGDAGQPAGEGACPADEGALPVPDAIFSNQGKAADQKTGEGQKEKEEKEEIEKKGDEEGVKKREIEKREIEKREKRKEGRKGGGKKKGPIRPLLAAGMAAACIAALFLSRGGLLDGSPDQLAALPGRAMPAAALEKGCAPLLKRGVDALLEAEDAPARFADAAFGQAVHYALLSLWEETEPVPGGTEAAGLSNAVEKGSGGAAGSDAAGTEADGPSATAQEGGGEATEKAAASEGGPLRIRDLRGITELSLDTGAAAKTLGGKQAKEEAVSSLADLALFPMLQSLSLRACKLDRGIDLSPIGALGRLETLDLHGKEISDIGALHGLAGLRYLDLGDNKIADISPLESLENLESLALYGNEVMDISPLSYMHGMRELYLDDNRIEDVTPLEEMADLQILRLDHNQIESIDSLQKLAGLVSLDLDHNQIEDIAPLAALSSLEEVWLGSNEIKNVDALQGLGNLTYLNLYHNDVDDLAPIGKIGGLRELVLSRNGLENLAPLEGLAGLVYLDLDRNKVSDLAPLKNLKNLQTLYLNNNAIADLAPLAGLTKLHTLGLGKNKITDLSALQKLAALESLDLYENQLQDIAALSECKKLTWLNIGENRIADIVPLKKMEDLETFQAYHNQIRDIGALEGLQGLKNLVFDNNRIQDISALAGHKKLERLYLEYNQITDVSPLGKDAKLKEVYLAGNQVADYAALEALGKGTAIYREPRYGDAHD